MDSYMAVMKKSFIRTYESFIVDQCHLTHKGLWFDGSNYVAVVSELKDGSVSINELESLYEKYRMITMPSPNFLSEPPSHAEELSVRSPQECISLHGEPLTTPELVNALSLQFSRSLHPFNFEYSHDKSLILFKFNRSLSEDEISEVEIACANLGLEYPPKCIVDENINDYPGIKAIEEDNTFTMDIIPTPYLSKDMPNIVLKALEQDEDFWVDNRHDLLTNIQLSRNDVLPTSFVSSKTACFVDASQFKRQNIRQYMVLYERVIIALPFIDRYESMYVDLCLQKWELLDLVRRGRIQFALPQNITRYNQGFIAELLDSNPEALVCTRRLAAASIIEIRNRTGIIGHSFDSREKYQFLNALKSVNSPFIQMLLSDLSSRWNNFERVINNQGACGVAHIGLSSMVSKIFESRGKDFGIELFTTAMSLEWSMGLGAHHFPFDQNSYSEVNAASILSGFYGGFRPDTSNLVESELGGIISKVLTINNDMSVLELDDILNSGDIIRLPTFLNNYAGLEKEEFEQQLYKLNSEVRKLESNRNRVSGMSVNGLISVGATWLSSEPTVGLLSWIIGALGNHVTHNKLAEMEVVDKLVAMNNRTNKDIVLVSRIRGALS